MPNKLTGDYEAMVQMAVRQINGLLATLHQNGVNEDAPLRLVHSAILRVTPSKRPFPDPHGFLEWVLAYQRTRPPAGIDGIRAELVSTAPPGAAHAFTSAFADLAGLHEVELTPMDVRGTAKAQISNLTISMPPGSTSEVIVHAQVRAHYKADPNTADLPAPLHGEVQVAFRVHRTGAKLSISLPLVDAKTRFVAAPGAGLSSAEEGRISQQVRNVVRSAFTLAPVDLPAGFPFPEFKGVGTGGGQAIALPLQLSGAQPPPPGLSAVTDSIVGPAGFAFAVGKEFILKTFEPTLAALRQITRDFTIPGVHIDVHFSVTDADLEFNDGSMDLVVRGKITPSAPGIGNIVVRQRFTLVLFLNTLFIAAPDDELHVSGAGPANSNVRSGVIAARNQQLPAAQNALNTQLNVARTQLEAAMRSFDPAASAKFRAGHSEDPGASASGAVAITEDGVIIRGDISGGARPAPIVHVAETNQHQALTALESWIPGGSIERLTWSWVEYPLGHLGGVSAWSGVVKSEIDAHGFIFPKPPGVNGVGQVCLRIDGTQTLANGAVVNVNGGTTCIVPVIDGVLEIPSWFEPVTVPIWVSDVSDNAVLRDAIAGHVSVQADPARKDELTHNSLVYFVDWRSDRPLGQLEDAIALMKRKRFSLATIVVLPAGAFDSRRREVEAKLKSIGERFPTEIHLTEDHEGGWTRTFAATKIPSMFLINARRQFVWKHEGDVAPKELAAALDEHLVPAPGPRSRPLRLAVAPGDRAPDCAFQEAGGDQSALHRLRGRSVLLNFWQSWSAPCLRELRRLEQLKQRSGHDAPSIVAFHGGKDEKQLDAIRKELRLSFSLVQDSEHRAARAYGVRCWPTTISINQDGRVDHIRSGLSAAPAPAPEPETEPVPDRKDSSSPYDA